MLDDLPQLAERFIEPFNGPQGRRIQEILELFTPAAARVLPVTWAALYSAVQMSGEAPARRATRRQDHRRIESQRL